MAPYSDELATALAANQVVRNARQSGGLGSNLPCGQECYLAFEASGIILYVGAGISFLKLPEPEIAALRDFLNHHFPADLENSDG